MILRKPLILPHYPAFYRSLIFLKVHADLDHTLVARFILYGIAFFIDLPERFLCRAIELEFKYINCIFSFYQRIATPCRAALLRAHRIF